MADEATPKKPAKKLVIIDANEEPEAPKTPPTDKEIAESTDEKVQVDEGVETNEAPETAEAPAETAETPESAEIPEESGDTPPVTDGEGVRRRDFINIAAVSAAGAGARLAPATSGGAA